MKTVLEIDSGECYAPLVLKPLTAFLLSLALGQFVLPMYYLYETYYITNIEQLANLQTTQTSLVAVRAATDMVLAVTLGFFLRRRRSGIKGTDSILNRMLIYSLVTGLIPTAWAALGIYAVQR